MTADLRIVFLDYVKPQPRVDQCGHTEAVPFLPDTQALEDCAITEPVPIRMSPRRPLGISVSRRARTVFGKPGSDGRECPARGSPASPPSHWAERAAEGAASASSGLLRAP